MAGRGADYQAVGSTFRAAWMLLLFRACFELHQSLRPMFTAPVPCWTEPCVCGPYDGAVAAWTLEGGKPLQKHPLISQ